MTSTVQPSIRTKLRLLTMVAAGSALVLASLGFITNDTIMLRRLTIDHLSAVADVLGANLVAPLTFDQPEPAQELLASLRFQPMIEFAGIYDLDGEPFAGYWRDAVSVPFPPAPATASERVAFTDHGILLTSEIRDSDGPVGVFVIRAGTEHLQAQLAYHLAMVAVVLAIASAVSYFISSILQKRIAQPVLELAHTVEQISRRRDYSVRVTPRSQDEIGSLYHAFNRMLDRIQAGEEQLRSAHEQLEERVRQRTQQLTTANQELAREVAERHRAEEELRAVQAQHVEAARKAGMAEIATSVLHNVGNVLNSINISASLLGDWFRKLGIADLSRATGLMQQHANDLAAYITHDQRGRHLPAFLIELSRKMEQDQQRIRAELESMMKNVEHIKEIVSLQQSFAGASGLIEIASLAELLDDAIKINEASIKRHRVNLVRQYQDLPPMPIDKQKFLQVCINLISNAKYAVFQQQQEEGGEIIVRLSKPSDEHVRVEVIDNGSGIAPENLTKIFAHGFTTKRDGHGFGLHSAALHAQQMGGRLWAASPGPGQGAVFTLELPTRTARQGNGDSTWLSYQTPQTLPTPTTTV